MTQLKLHPTPHGLALKNEDDPKVKPLLLDFLNPMHLKNRGKGDLLARAVGLKSLAHPMIYDLTCGLAQDALFLASLGCRVYAFERHPDVFALVQDAYVRACADSHCPSWLRDNLVIGKKEGRELLLQLQEVERPEVIYLDPMYPEKKSGHSRKEMRFLQELVGADSDSQQLGEMALSRARLRVVVKRPLRAPALMAKPSHTLRGTTVRYDVYLVKN